MSAPIGISVRHEPPRGKHLPERYQIMFRFDNGWRVSAVYGDAIYSRNSKGERFTHEINEEDYATAVEIAIFDAAENMVPFKNGENIKGFAMVAELHQILEWVSTR